MQRGRRVARKGSEGSSALPVRVGKNFWQYSAGDGGSTVGEPLGKDILHDELRLQYSAKQCLFQGAFPPPSKQEREPSFPPRHCGLTLTSTASLLSYYLY